MIDYSMYMIHDSFGLNISKGSEIIQSGYSLYYTNIYYFELLKKKNKINR